MYLDPKRMPGRERARTRSTSSPSRTAATTPRRVSASASAGRARESTQSRERSTTRSRSRSTTRSSSRSGRGRAPTSSLQREDVAGMRAQRATPPGGIPGRDSGGSARVSNTVARAMARRTPAAASRGPRSQDIDVRSEATTTPPRDLPGRDSGGSAGVQAAGTTASQTATPLKLGIGLAGLAARLTPDHAAVPGDGAPSQPTTLRDRSLSTLSRYDSRDRGWTSSGEDEWDDVELESQWESEQFVGPTGDRLRWEIRSELEALTFGGVYRKALDCGIQPGDATPEGCDSEQEVKNALVEFMMGNPEFQRTDSRFEDARIADMEDDIREELAPMPLGLILQRAQAADGVSEEALFKAQDSDSPKSALVDLLATTETQSQIMAEQTEAAIRIQAHFRGHRGRKTFQRTRAQTLLENHESEEEAKAERRKARLAEEVAALQRGDSIISIPFEAGRSRTLLLPGDPTSSILQSPSGDGTMTEQGIRRTERVAAELFALRKASDDLRPERSVYSSGQGDKREGQRPRVSGIQADLARGERATRRSVLEAELAQLQHSFHQRLAGNRSAGQAILDPSLRAAAVSPSTVEGDVSPPDTDSAQVDVTPRQRVWEAERRWEKRVDALARQELAVVRIQAMVRGFRARAKTRSRLATQRDVRTHFSALTARAHRIQ